jgi:hypothetical protein
LPRPVIATRMVATGASFSQVEERGATHSGCLLATKDEKMSAKVVEKQMQVFGLRLAQIQPNFIQDDQIIQSLAAPRRVPSTEDGFSPPNGRGDRIVAVAYFRTARNAESASLCCFVALAGACGIVRSGFSL